MKKQFTITTHPVVVALGATLLFMESVMLFHAPLLLLDLLMVFSLTLSAYAFPSANEFSGLSKVINRVFFLVAVTSAVLSLLMGGTLSRMMILSSCLILFFFYRFGSVIGFSFRGSPMLKGPIIALCWTIITVYLPVNIYEITIYNLELTAMVMLNFSMVLAMAWLCDLADLKNDAGKGLQTISVQLGPKGTILLVLLVMLACTIALALAIPPSSNVLRGALVTDVFVGLAILTVAKLPGSSAKWMVDALLLCKPLAMICLFH